MPILRVRERWTQGVAQFTTVFFTLTQVTPVATAAEYLRAPAANHNRFTLSPLRQALLGLTEAQAQYLRQTIAAEAKALLRTPQVLTRTLELKPFLPEGVTAVPLPALHAELTTLIAQGVLDHGSTVESLGPTTVRLTLRYRGLPHDDITKAAILAKAVQALLARLPTGPQVPGAPVAGSGFRVSSPSSTPPVTIGTALGDAVKTQGAGGAERGAAHFAGEGVDWDELNQLSKRLTDEAKPLVDELRRLDAPHILVVVGGVIPPKDVPFLKQRGVACVFLPQTPLPQAAAEVLAAIPRRAPGRP